MNATQKGYTLKNETLNQDLCKHLQWSLCKTTTSEMCLHSVPCQRCKTDGQSCHQGPILDEQGINVSFFASSSSSSSSSTINNEFLHLQFM